MSDMNLLILSFVFMLPSTPEHDFGNRTDGNVAGITTDVAKDTTILMKIPVYHASPCIENLLRQVAKANRRNYDPKTYFNSLLFKKEGDKRYLVIELGRYKSSRVFDYVGVLRIYSSIFLCRGDIRADTLFRSNNDAFLNVSLVKRKNSDDFDYGKEPSLRGSYQECSGIRISLEVYTRATIPGYRMEKPKRKS
jgi:hypothetical protein